MQRPARPPSAVPVWVAAPAGAVAIQGVYTLVWLVGRVPVASRTADLLFAAGEGAGYLLGATGVVAAIIRQSATTTSNTGRTQCSRSLQSTPDLVAAAGQHRPVGSRQSFRRELTT